MTERLGKYELLAIIGRGGMGTVYRAFDPLLGRHVALKVVSLQDELSGELKTRLLREGQACVQLTHPNIITVYDLGEDHGRFFLVMELLNGEDLKKVIAAHGALSLPEKLSLMVQVCDGLGHAHERGIVHRDIKPGNIFVLPDRRLKILDFGLAQVAAGESSLTQSGQIVGTLAYMAPERFRMLGDHRADVFAVGAVCYELLTGRRAFAGDTAPQLIELIRTAEPPSIRSIDCERVFGARGCHRASAREGPVRKGSQLAGHVRRSTPATLVVDRGEYAPGGGTW